MNAVNEVIKTMNSQDLMLLTRWMIATLEGKSDDIFRSNQAILIEGTQGLQYGMMLFATCDSDELRGYLQVIYNFVSARDVRRVDENADGSASSQPVFESALRLREVGDTLLRNCVVVVEASNGKLRVKVTFNTKATGEDLYNDFCETYDLDKSQFSLKWGGYGETSTLNEYDVPYSYLPDGQVLHLVVKLKF